MISKRSILDNRTVKFSVYTILLDAVQNSKEWTPPIVHEYMIFSLNEYSFRKGIRNNTIVLDKTLTDVGFFGTEDIDWVNVSYTIL